MTSVIRPITSVVLAVFKLFVDDGVYAAVTIAWITAIIVLGPHSATSSTGLVLTGGSHSGKGFLPGGLLLAVGLDAIFAVSVILRLQSTLRSRTGKKEI